MGNENKRQSEINGLTDWHQWPTVDAFKNEPAQFQIHIATLAKNDIWVASRTFETRCNPGARVIEKGTILQVKALTVNGHALVDNPKFRFQQWLSGHELTEVHAQGQSAMDASSLASWFTKSPRPEDVKENNENNVIQQERKFSFPSDSGDSTDSLSEFDSWSPRAASQQTVGARKRAESWAPGKQEARKYILSPRTRVRGLSLAATKNTTHRVLPHQKSLKRHPKSTPGGTTSTSRTRHKSALYSTRYRS